MGRSLGLALILGWCVVVAVLFRRLGPRRAVLIAVVGGNLLIPTLAFDLLSGSRLQLTQPVAIGLAVLGVVLGDPRALSFSRIRVHWLDLPMLAYLAYPLSGLLTDGSVAAWDVADLILKRGLGVLVPYAAARRYLDDAEGARQVAIAIVVATLLYVPVVGFEAVMGPPWYLGRLYGAVPIETMDSRLGGWRPEGFFLNGLTLATWMAVAAVVAFGVGLGRVWRPRWGPAWWPALVLVLASVGCRGVYGYIVLGVGLAVAAITGALRTRWAIAPLVLAVPLYIGLRVAGAWDGRVLVRMAERTGRAATVAIRLQAEDGVITWVREQRPVLGFGVQFWHARNIERHLAYWPDGRWLLELWTGGMAGLALQLTALALLPVGAALTLAWPTGVRGPSDAGARAAILVLALFSALCLLDGLHNNAYFTPQALVAGTLVGMAVRQRQGRRPASPPGAHMPAWPAASRPGHDLSLVPIVTATACVLYVFAHAPVAGHEGVKLVGGLGAGLLFAAAGAIGAWATALAPLSRLAAFAGLFAALGVSFNLALHPASAATVATADILQGLALCGLAVACWRRWVGGGDAAGAVLVALPLLAHFLLRGSPLAFPGSQYLYAGGAGERSLFPLFPWLTMAALGAQAAARSAVASGAAAALFAAAATLAWWSEPGSERLVKFPMDPAYALLSCAAIEAAFCLAHPLKRLGALARGARWLGRNWLIYFYLHFAIALALGRLRPGPAAVVWILLAVCSVAATWVAARATAAGARVFQVPAAWLVPLALILLAAGLPGHSPWAVAVLAGSAGLIFAAYYDTLAYLIVNPSLSALGPGLFRGSGGPGHSLARVAVVFALLVVPEVVGLLTGPESSPASAPPPPLPPARDGGPRPRPAPEAAPEVAPSGFDKPKKRNTPRPGSDRAFAVTYSPDRTW